MNHKLIIAAVALVIIIGGVYWFYGRSAHKVNAPVSTYAVDPLNASYSIETKSVQLVNGSLTQDIVPGSASKLITRIFGEPVVGDLNGDGKPDAAILLSQTTGGTGVFYYVVAALNTGLATRGTNAILIGDRIAPQNIQITDGKIVVNYADRLPSQPMTAQPSVGVSRYFIIQNGTLVELK